MTRVAEVDLPTFGDRLSERVLRRESQIVLGLDPDPTRLWPRAVPLAGGGAEPGPPAARAAAAAPADVAGRAAAAVAAHCRLVIEAAGEFCVAVKPQVACFERLGAPGWAALAEVVALARSHDLLVIADAKRGDIDVSAAAYAAAFFGQTPTPFGPVPGLGADALTVNPYLGRDALEPFVTAARASGGGVFVLARTSNPGAADLQELAVAFGGTVAGRVAELIDALGRDGVGAGGLSDVGAVVGATAPHRLAELRELMPRAPFLLPGIGRQGGRPEDLGPVFGTGPAGGLASASRSIVDAGWRTGADPAAAAAAEARRLRDAAWQAALAAAG